jgi:hypothetical protein
MAIKLDEILNESTENPTTLTESVTEHIVENVDVDLDAILLEWSYRCEKGYPDFNNKKDMIALNKILKEMNLHIPSKLLTEASLTSDGDELMAKLSDKKLNIRPEALSQIESILGNRSAEQQKELNSKFQSFTLQEFIKSGYKVFKDFWNAKASQGMGRGEMMCVMGIKGAESGGNKEKDLIINSEKGREVWEVKEDPTGIRMAQSGFSGRFEYIQKMSQFYNMLKIIELDSEKDDVLLENLKKVFAQEQVANDMLSILKFNFRGDGYGQSKKDKEEGTAITKANFFDRMIVAAEFPTGVIDLHYTGFQKLSKLKADILKNSDLINNAKLLVKTADKDSEYFINKDDAKDIENAKPGEEVRINVAAPVEKDFKIFLYNILNIVNFEFVKDPDAIPRDFVKRKNEYFSDISGYVYFLENNPKPIEGHAGDFVIYGISQGMGKMESKEKANKSSSPFIKAQMALSQATTA